MCITIPRHRKHDCPHGYSAYRLDSSSRSGLDPIGVSGDFGGAHDMLPKDKHGEPFGLVTQAGKLVWFRSEDGRTCIVSENP